MKRKLAFGALLVLGGLVSLGALLMWGVFDIAPSASATDVHPLIVKTGPHPNLSLNQDVEVVGDVYLNLCHGTLNVEFSTPDNMLDEVHACVATHVLPWLPPGNERKCEMAGGYFGAEESCGTGLCIANIDMTGNGSWCGARVYVQAHAAVDGVTAYGDKWKGGFWATITCCCG